MEDEWEFADDPPTMLSFPMTLSNSQSQDLCAHYVLSFY